MPEKWGRPLGSSRTVLDANSSLDEEEDSTPPSSPPTNAAVVPRRSKFDDEEDDEDDVLDSWDAAEDSEGIYAS